MLWLMLKALGGGLGGVLAARAAGVSRSRAGVSRSQAGVSRSRAWEDENIGSLTLLGSTKWDYCWHLLRQIRGHLQYFGDRFFD